jgi:phospholipase/carboxylesterase
MADELVSFGPLQCRLANHRSAASSPRRMAVLSHGFGAPGADLFPLAEQMTDAFPDLADTVFVFPEGPLALDQYGIPGGRAWWMIDRRFFQQLDDYGQVRDQSLLHPPELITVRDQYLECVNAALAHFDLDMERCVLGGFSQGAMVATDAALRGPIAPAGLCIWSATFLYPKEWTAAVAERKYVSIFQSHGYHDPLLPFALARKMHETFVAKGADAEFCEFVGEHAIPAEATQGLAALLRRI